MASEMINTVCEAEKKAQEAVENALKEADKILGAARKSADDADATSRHQAEVKAKRITDTAGGVAREEAIKAEKSAAEKGAQMVEQSKQKQNEVTKCVKRILIS